MERGASGSVTAEGRQLSGSSHRVSTGDHGTEVLWVGSRQERQKCLKSHRDPNYCPGSFVCFPANYLPGFSYTNEQGR